MERQQLVEDNQDGNHSFTTHDATRFSSSGSTTVVDEILISVVIPVFNDAQQAQRTFDALASQRDTGPLEIVVVDDGSPNPLVLECAATETMAFQLVRLQENQGRAAACNAGFQASRGEVVLFLDVDCEPDRDHLINLRKCVRDGASLVFGHIVFVSGDRFFDQYEDWVQQCRRDNIEHWARVLTTANFALRRELFEIVGGFSEVYRHYGFEDRDLLLRLKQAQPELVPVYSDQCLARHVDVPTLAGLLRKFENSGRYSARVFASAHPRAYRLMPQFRFDAVRNPMLNKVPSVLLCWSFFFFDFAAQAAYRTATAIEWNSLRANLLRLLKGFAYLRGTLKERDA
jgi:glycosyltransferase involved in cell wall biosynthesis